MTHITCRLTARNRHQLRNPAPEPYARYSSMDYLYLLLKVRMSCSFIESYLTLTLACMQRKRSALWQNDASLQRDRYLELYVANDFSQARRHRNDSTFSAFLPRDAMLAPCMRSSCPSVCPSVRLSQAGLESKRLREWSCWFLAWALSSTCPVF